MKPIVVQLANEQWTLKAMHLACGLARQSNGQVVLLHLAVAQNPGLLGWGIPFSSEKENSLFDEYAAVAEDYGVDFRLQPMHYITQIDALIQAAEQLDAFALFARIGGSPLQIWNRFQHWNLQRRLGRCRLYTLAEIGTTRVEEPVSITV